MTKSQQVWLVLLACVGLASASTSTYVHFQLLSDPGYASFCDINASVSCTQVYQSRYGTVFDIPVALGGVIWFLGVLLLAFAGAYAPEESKTNVAGYLLVWSTLGLAVAMYMAYLSFFVLSTYCVLCVAVYVAVVGIFVLSGNGVATPTRRLPSAVFYDLGRVIKRPVGAGLLLLFIGGAFGSMAWFARGVPSAVSLDAVRSADVREPSSGSVDQQTEFARYWDSQPRLELTLPPSKAAALGAEPTVIILKFNDYQCPACGNAHRAYGPIFAKYASSHPGLVQQVVVDYPLDPACNASAPTGLHHGACAAAVAVRLAATVSDAAKAEMEEWLYSNQQGLSRSAVVEALGDVAGIGADRYDDAYDAMVLLVQADIAFGDELPVEATPTYVINGVLIKGTLAPQYFDAAIARELSLKETSTDG